MGIYGENYIELCLLFESSLTDQTKEKIQVSMVAKRNSRRIYGFLSALKKTKTCVTRDLYKSVFKQMPLRHLLARFGDHIIPVPRF